MRYEVHKKNKEIYICDSNISFNDDVISIKSKLYSTTRNLLELLFKKSSEDSLITQHDKTKYLEVNYGINTHRKNFDPNNSIYKDSSAKFHKYIADFMAKFDKGLPIFMNVKKLRAPVDNARWDNPNKLVDR